MENRKEPLSEKELFKLVEFASFVFAKADATEFKSYLKRLLKTQLPVVHEIVVTDNLKWFTYVLRLVFTCPSFLEKHAGFEWVAKQFQQILGYRTANPDFERDFWKAMDTVRATLRPVGRPRRKDKDIFRAWNVSYYMDHDGLSKTSAVKKVAEEEVQFITRKTNGDPIDQANNKEKEIWESLKRVEKDEQEFMKLLTEWGIRPDR